MQDSQTLKTHIADRLRELRKERGIRQKELDQLIGLPVTSISKIERGKREATAVEIVQICSVFGVTVQSFLDPDSPVVFVNEAKLVEAMRTMPAEDYDLIIDQIKLYQFKRGGSLLNVGRTDELPLVALTAEQMVAVWADRYAHEVFYLVMQAPVTRQQILQVAPEPARGRLDEVLVEFLRHELVEIGQDGLIAAKLADCRIDYTADSMNEAIELREFRQVSELFRKNVTDKKFMRQRAQATLFGLLTDEQIDDLKSRMRDLLTVARNHIASNRGKSVAKLRFRALKLLFY